MAVNKVVINHDGVENVLVDITDSTVTPDDMPEGVTAYDKSGEKITGSMEHLYDGNARFTSVPVEQENDGRKEIMLTYPVTKRKFLNAHEFVTQYAKLRDFGTATAEDVAAGKTFTSADGLDIPGNLPNLNRVYANGTDIMHSVGDDGKYYLYLSGNSDDRGILDVGSRVEISCPVSPRLGDATADDVSDYVTFTSAEGVNIQGNLSRLYSTSIPESESTIESHEGALCVKLFGKPIERGIIDVDVEVSMLHPLSSFGDVKDTEVMYGKTFTSAFGLRRTGTGGVSSIKAENATIGVRNAGDTVGVAQAHLQTENGYVIRPNAVVEVEFPLSALGNATPEDVLAGKSFSSDGGIQRVGTLEVGIKVTDDGNGNLTIMNAVVTDNDGNVTVTM